MDAAIELRNVALGFPGGRFRLQVDELRVERGERVACIGPSGSGKTTLVNLVAGILLPEQGTVSVLGRVVSQLGDRERRTFRRTSLGLVFQELELVDYLSARDNVLLPHHVGAGVSAADRARVEELASGLGIAALLDRKPARLSQGERQRVAIARALITSPALLLCDEPTGNLDPATSHETVALLFAEAQRRGTTVLFVTHDHSLLDRFDRTIDVTTLYGAPAP